MSDKELDGLINHLDKVIELKNFAMIDFKEMKISDITDVLKFVDYLKELRDLKSQKCEVCRWWRELTAIQMFADDLDCCAGIRMEEHESCSRWKAK